MILIDPRSGSDSLVEYLPEHSAMLASPNLEAGDASFLGNFPDGQFPIGIEIKRINTGDLWDSLSSGRFIAGQLPKLAHAYRRVYLIVEGYWRSGSDGSIEIPEWTNVDYRKHSTNWVKSERQILYRSLDNWLNSIQELGHVVIKRTNDIVETAQQILDLYLWWSKPYEYHNSLAAFDESKLPVSLFKPVLTCRVAKELEGIGWTRSKAVAEHFPTVEEMILANQQEWMKIPGVGKKLSEKIYSQLRTPNQK